MRRCILWVTGVALVIGNAVVGVQTYRTMQAVEKAALAVERSVNAATRAFIAEDR